jgi:hypothetical protein
MRWRRGQPVGLEYYLDRHAELGPARSLPAALVFQEYQVRHCVGDRPALAAYQQRFPDQFEELGKLAMQETRTPPATSTLPTPPVSPAPPPPATAPDDGEKAPGETVLPVLGGYKPRQRIGTAAFGEVWQAEAPGGVPVAIKILFRPVDAEEARRELAALELIREIRHHCLVQLHGFWSSHERLYIVMELADGSLRDRLEACRREGLQGIPSTSC